MTKPPTKLDPLTVPFMLRRELLDEGWNDKVIYRNLTDGSWTRIRHGAFVETSSWRLMDQAARHVMTTRAAVKQARTKVIVSHTSAALLYGAPSWGLPLEEVHLTRVDAKVGRREAGVAQHRGVISHDDVVEGGELALMSATRTALEVITVAPVEAAVCAVSHLLHVGLTTEAKLEERCKRTSSSLVQWPGSRTNELVLRLADPRFESVGEARTFVLCWRHSIPAPTPQKKVYDEAGNLLGRVDFAWPDLGVFLEFDGKVKYEKLLRPGESASDVVVREKKREEEICRATGWRCLRITWKDLENPEATAAMILAFLFPGSAGRRTR